MELGLCREMLYHTPAITASDEVMIKAKMVGPSCSYSQSRAPVDMVAPVDRPSSASPSTALLSSQLEAASFDQTRPKSGGRGEAVVAP